MKQENKMRKFKHTKRRFLHRIKKTNMSLRMRYTVIFSLIIAACFGLLGTAMAVFSVSYSYEQNAKLLSENAHNVADNASSMLTSGYISMFGDDNYSIAALCSSLGMISESINADVFICDTSGYVIMCRDYFVNGMLVDYSCAEHDNLIMTQEIMQGVLKGAYSKVDDLDGLYDGLHYIAGEPVKVHGQTVAVAFAVAPVTNAVISFMMPIIQLFFISAFIALAFAVVAVSRMVNTFTKPLRKLADVTRSYAEGDFTPRVEVDRDDEIGQLAQAFNSMAGSLAQLEGSRRSFVANVSHELKTPMTTIGGFIDGILDGTIPESQRAYYLKIVSDEVKRLSRIVVSMLNLSKIEAGQLDLSFDSVNLSELILTTFLNFEKKISDGKIEVRGMEFLGSYMVCADRDMIGQVVYNLVDNAVKFTPENGHIRVEIAENDGMIETKISNSGAGIAQDELDKIFERFYKVDKSRSYDAKSTGLGLHIVRSILELHGGKISATSELGRYTEFVFTLPSAQNK